MRQWIYFLIGLIIINCLDFRYPIMINIAFAVIVWAAIFVFIMILGFITKQPWE